MIFSQVLRFSPPRCDSLQPKQIIGLTLPFHTRSSELESDLWRLHSCLSGFAALSAPSSCILPQRVVVPRRLEGCLFSDLGLVPKLAVCLSCGQISIILVILCSCSFLAPSYRLVEVGIWHPVQVPKPQGTQSYGPVVAICRNSQLTLRSCQAHACGYYSIESTPALSQFYACLRMLLYSLTSVTFVILYSYLCLAPSYLLVEISVWQTVQVNNRRGTNPTALSSPIRRSSQRTLLRFYLIESTPILPRFYAYVRTYVSL